VPPEAGYDLKLEILLPQHPECWDYTHSLPCPSFKAILAAGCRWFTPVIPATQESELRKNMFKVSPCK
jgi:hypothetical protein